MSVSLFSKHHQLGGWYNPVQIGCSSIISRAKKKSTYQRVLDVLERVDPDDYSEYLKMYLSEGLKKCDVDWGYLDITNVLYAASELIQPARYLEIGVRRGRSMAMVASACPQVDIVGFDMWIENYAGMPNPGPQFVENEVRKFGHTGRLTLLDGNSHNTVPEFFKENRDEFDLITVDGDHSDEGAMDDLMNILPHLSLGGVVVFDDILHPAHPNLRKVWLSALDKFPGRFNSFEYVELGYGIAIAVRVL